MAWLLTLILILLTMIYHRLAIYWIILAASLILAAYLYQQDFPPSGKILLTCYLALIFISIPKIRQQLISRWLFKLMKAALPSMSQTEREALEAGNTWWDAELFTGRPDWKVLQNLPPSRLSPEEQAFIDGPVETLCAMLDDWDITHNRKDLPKEVWDYIKQHKFCGIIIPKQYGGLEFSEAAHSEAVMKISSRSTTAAVTVMVPNSLGPAKLLLNYGTEEQKNHYLPRLAKGEEIPAFALTGPHAGSDAGAMPDTGIVCYGTFEGKDKVLGIRLNWEKRYITLGPVATVLGLAFKLYDPDHLIGDKENIGITAALIPTNTPGVNIGRRHFPLDSAFQNGPNWGKDVFIPMDWVIGGVTQVGNGWKMLMQCLATGRAISLPALSVGASKFTCRNVGAYARIRKQFNLPIAEFEGIEEVLARMAGETYIQDAARQVTNAALDQGEKPAVISAILKYELTERMRRVVNDGMDILGGAGICLGPKNYLGRVYQVIPVSITVEGANILTRTMMIFGQGAIRCHPYIQQEIAAIAENDLPEFDKAIFRHVSFFASNKIASFWLGLTHGCFLRTPGNKATKRYYRQVARLSAAFALLTDFGLLTLGGKLKRKERLSGCYADALANLYLSSCILKHHEDQGNLAEDLPLLHWACRESLYRAQQALLDIIRKLPFKPISCWLYVLVFPLGKFRQPAKEKLIPQLAAILSTASPSRDRLTKGIYISANPADLTGRIETAFKAVLAAEPVEAKLKQAQKQGKLVKGDLPNVVNEGLAQQLISKEEALLLTNADEARLKAITVDDFDSKTL